MVHHGVRTATPQEIETCAFHHKCYLQGKKCRLSFNAPANMAMSVSQRVRRGVVTPLSVATLAMLSSTISTPDDGGGVALNMCPAAVPISRLNPLQPSSLYALLPHT